VFFDTFFVDPYGVPVPAGRVAGVLQERCDLRAVPATTASSHRPATPRASSLNKLVGSRWSWLMQKQPIDRLMLIVLDTAGSHETNTSWLPGFARLPVEVLAKLIHLR